MHHASLTALICIAEKCQRKIFCQLLMHVAKVTISSIQSLTQDKLRVVTKLAKFLLATISAFMVGRC